MRRMLIMPDSMIHTIAYLILHEIVKFLRSRRTSMCMYVTHTMCETVLCATTTSGDGGNIYTMSVTPYHMMRVLTHFMFILSNVSSVSDAKCDPSI